jgi:Transcription initiation factor IID, 31kD subunit
VGVYFRKGVEEYEPRVLKQLLDFMYRYLVDTLQDAEVCVCVAAALRKQSERRAALVFLLSVRWLSTLTASSPQPVWRTACAQCVFLWGINTSRVRTRKDRGALGSGQRTDNTHSTGL